MVHLGQQYRMLHPNEASNEMQLKTNKHSFDGVIYIDNKEC